MNLLSLLEGQARERPDQAAFIEGGGKRGRRSVSFAEFETRIRMAAGELDAIGIRRGDVVLMLHPVSIDLYVALLSVMRIGAVVMFADPGAGRAGFRAAIERVKPRAFFGSPKAHLLRLREPAIRRIPIQLSNGGLVPFSRRWPRFSRRSNASAAIADTGEDDPALITFTSGGTGTPKAVVRTHGFLLAQNESLRSALDLEAGEIDLITLPVFALANLAAGLTSVIADTDLAKPGSADAGVIDSQLVRERVTRCAASPAFFTRLLDKGADLSPLRKVFTGGAPVFPPLLERLSRSLGKAAQVTAVYGSTEAEPIAHLTAEEITESDREQMRSGGGLLAGNPVPDIETAILPIRDGETIGPMAAEAFQALKLPPGKSGEIVVSGAHVLTGYLGGVGDAETKIRVDGGTQIWHRTGDAGRFDEAGRLWLLGRCGAVIRGDRGDVFPFALETALSFENTIRRSALIPMGDERVLALEPARGKSEALDLRTVRELLDRAEIDRYEILDSIPLDRRHNAKVDYPALRARLERDGHE